MLEARRVAGFPNRTLAQDIPLALGQAGFDVDLLYSHGALEAFVDSTPYNACAAATNTLDQAVMLRDLLTGIDGAYSEPSRNCDIPRIDHGYGPSTSVAGPVRTACGSGGIARPPRVT
ncbi:hypothetical protein GCM10011610_61160 [Nocardia rhizosphaerihabitans]|uniref:Uncharacterized protein n=1 Tax=Nocardia rhizosphaerihabitans TaxID=1691570 RepID=A0ABQ2KXN5_9NOCA|nr:hypothetical protein GCM10011610_61160 [Nocardia rhizosphaerihabitans]